MALFFSRRLTRVTLIVVYGLLFAKIRIPAANLYSSHGLRRGDAQELKESGSQWPIVASVGQWKGFPFVRTLTSLTSPPSTWRNFLFVLLISTPRTRTRAPRMYVGGCSYPRHHGFPFNPTYPSVSLRISPGCFGFFFF